MAELKALLRRVILCGLFDQHRNNHAKIHRLCPLFPVRCDECNEFFYADYWPDSRRSLEESK